MRKRPKSPISMILLALLILQTGMNYTDLLKLLKIKAIKLESERRISIIHTLRNIIFSISIGVLS